MASRRRRQLATGADAPLMPPSAASALFCHPRHVQAEYTTIDHAMPMRVAGTVIIIRNYHCRRMPRAPSAQMLHAASAILPLPRRRQDASPLHYRQFAAPPPPDRRIPPPFISTRRLYGRMLATHIFRHKHTHRATILPLYAFTVHAAQKATLMRGISSSASITSRHFLQEEDELARYHFPLSRLVPHDLCPPGEL